MSHKKTILNARKTFKTDTLKIVIGPKNVIFNAMVDDCGNEFEIDRKKLLALLE